jgi:hypothetical protein
MNLQFPTSREIGDLFNKNGGAILDNISQEEVDRYLFLRTRISDVEVSEDKDFRDTFKEAYRLDRKRLSQAFKERYFELMEETKSEERFDFYAGFRELYGENGRTKLGPVQFSFLTKMANTIDESYPIYEKPLADLFEFKQPQRHKQTARERLRIYMDFYNHVRDTYQELIEEEMIYDLLKVFKIRFRQSDQHVPMMKRVDLLARSAGDLKNRGKLIHSRLAVV